MPMQKAGSAPAIAALIRWSVANRFLVLIIATAFLVAAGLWSALHTPVDAITGPVDTQVIVRTSYPGNYKVVEDPGHLPADDDHAQRARRRQDGARLFPSSATPSSTSSSTTRPTLLGALAGRRVPQPGQNKLPLAPMAALGPDATGVGWVYEYALVDRTGKTDLGSCAR